MLSRQPKIILLQKAFFFIFEETILFVENQRTTFGLAFLQHKAQKYDENIYNSH
jgi:hypothetical protein